MAQNRLKQISNIIYGLKRAWGVQIYIYRENTIDQNVKTGTIDRTYTRYTIRRAAMLPARIQRDFVYDLSFIAANKNFTYGGLFDPKQRRCIIDKKDLKQITINLNDYVIYDNQRYTVKEAIPVAENKAVLLTIKRTASMPNDLLIVADTKVEVTQSAEGEIDV